MQTFTIFAFVIMTENNAYGQTNNVWDCSISSSPTCGSNANFKGGTFAQELAAGIYNVQLIDGDRVKTEKLIVQK